MLKRGILHSFSGRRYLSMLFVSSFSMVAEILVMLICKIVASNLIGETALAAVTMVTPLFSFVLFVGACIACGTTICYTTAVGELKPEEAAKHFGQGVLLALFSGVVLFGFFALARDAILEFLGVPPELVMEVLPFYKWFLGVVLVLPVGYFLAELVYADGDEVLTFWSYGILIAAEMALSLYFVDSMGIAGLGLALFVASILFLGVLLLHFFKKSNSLHFKLHVNVKDIASVFRFSVAKSSAYLCFSIFTFLLTRFFLRSCDPDSMPVLAMIFEVVELGSVFGGIWLAAEPLVSVYRGERNLIGVRRVMKYVNESILVEGVLMTVFLIVWAPFLADLFHIHSASILPEAIWAVRVASIGCLVKAFQRVYAPFYQHHNPLFSMFIVLMRDLLMPILCCVILGSLYGSYGIWVGLAVAPFISFAICVVAFLAFYGKKYFPLLLHRGKDLWKAESCEVTPQNIVALRDHMGDYLRKKNVENSICNKVMLLVEELGMHIYDVNRNRKVYTEFSVRIFQGKVICVMKDNGVLQNMTDLEMVVSDLRAYFVTALMAYQREKLYMLTMSYNRHVFRFDRESWA